MSSSLGLLVLQAYLRVTIKTLHTWIIVDHVCLCLCVCVSINGCTSLPVVSKRPENANNKRT